MAMVELLTTEVVVPAEETPSGAIWLSNLDLATRGGYMPTVFFYQTNNKPEFFDTDAVKDSLARALVAFYPLAGRLGLDAATGRVQIDCTARGAVFVTARSVYTLDELLNEFVPCDKMRDLLVPATPVPNPPCPLLFAQVTRLRCGSVVLGLALHHTVVDGRSAAHFRETWAMLAHGGGTGGDAALPPCFDHRLVSARPPATRAVTYDHLEYKPEPSPPVHVVAASSACASAIITLSKAEVTVLKARCPGASTFRAVVVLVWQCVCLARALPPETETRLYTMIDKRSRLDPPLPPGYFGNAVVHASVAATAGEVVGNPVGYAAHRVLAATSQGDDYARSLVDYLEGVEGVDAVNLPRSGISRAHLWAISWMGMSLRDFDFGWGAPVFRCPALIYYSGFVFMMPAPGQEGAVTLALSLEPESMPEFRKMFAQELARLQTVYRVACKI